MDVDITSWGQVHLRAVLGIKAYLEKTGTSGNSAFLWLSR